MKNLLLLIGLLLSACEQSRENRVWYSYTCYSNGTKTAEYTGCGEMRGIEDGGYMIGYCTFNGLNVWVRLSIHNCPMTGISR